MRSRSIDTTTYYKQSLIGLLICLWHFIAIPLMAQSLEQIPLKDFLFLLEDTYQVSIIYKSDLVKNKAVSPAFNSTLPIEKILQQKLYTLKLEHRKISNAVYVILPKARKKPLSCIIKESKHQIKGKVKSRSGETLTGVNILIKPSLKGVSSDVNGLYQIDNLDVGTYTLEVSYIGYITQKKTITVLEKETVTPIDFFLSEDLLELRTIIVTGVQSPVSNLQSSLAATNISTDDIIETAPRSVADLLQTIPGFYVESSGGVVNNNLFSRGMSAEGSYQYVVLHEDGLPIYEAGNVDWVDADNYYRIDNTLKNVEAIRGSAGVFASNAPGGIINFVSKTGQKKFKGIAKLQVSDFGQVRTAFNVGGSLKEKYRYNVGAFYREDNGVRPTGFKANKGGQIKANVTRLFDKGFLRISGKYLNDRNTFYLPIPLKNTASAKGLPFFDPNYGTMTSVNIQEINFPTPEGIRTYDLKDGVHTDLNYIGSHFSYKFGDGWQINNRNRWSQIDKNNNSIISIFNPMTTESYAQQFAFDSLNLTPRYTYRDGGSVFDPLNPTNNGLVVEAGWWVNQSQLTNFINSFEVTKTSENFDFTGGAYVSYFTKNTQQNWANILLEVNGNQPRALNLDFVNANNEVVQSATHDGYTTYQSFDTYQNSFGNASSIAGFVYGTYRLSKESNLDGGLRAESLLANGSLENSKLYDLNTNNTNNPVLATIRYGDSTFTNYSISKSALAWTFGFNHTLGTNSSYFIRLSDGYRMPDFDSWERGQSDGGQVEFIIQAEAGYKYTTDRFALFTAAFINRIKNQLTTDASIDMNGNILPLRTRGARTLGIEVETITKISTNFQLDITATFQQARYQVTHEQELDPNNPINGNKIKRIPSLFFRINPSYQIGNFKVFGTIQYIGDRYGDEFNTNPLPAFTSYNTGISLKYKDYQFLMQVQNVTNTIGLTEGNPRIIGADQTMPTRMARPILGRSVIAFVSYQF